MAEPIDLRIDVTDAVDLGIDAHTTVTIFVPDGPLSDPPVVCFAFPGGGYSRRYFSFDMPDSSAARGGEARFHTDRGWIFVACDHLGFGDSTVPDDPFLLTLDNIALGNKVTVEAVMARIESGTLSPDLPAVTGAVKIGIGQSMGGHFGIVQQGQHHTFDGFATLGASAIHTVVPNRPGTAPAAWPWIPRSSRLDNPTVFNASAMAAAAATESPTIDGNDAANAAAIAGEHPFQWAFHYDDVPADIVAMDMAANAATEHDDLPPWRSRSIPACGLHMVAPGAVALEAACITVPILSATGERDVVPDPWMEPKAFKSSGDITVYVCPRMGHMHNFASTRVRFWQRIHSWGTGVAHARLER